MNFDTVLDLELFSRFTAVFSYLTGATNRVGFHRHTGEGLFRGNFLTRRVNYNTHQHMALNFLALVGSLGAPLDEIPLLKQDVRRHLVELPRHAPTPDARQAVLEILKSANSRIDARSSLLLFNPDPGDQLPIRGWPEERFADVARQLLDLYPHSYAVVIGLGRSRPFAERLVRIVGQHRCADLTGRTTGLDQVLTLCTLSKILITNDSGPAHLAALTQLQSVVLFGPETPALYGPLGGRSISLFSGYSCSPCLSAANHRHTWCRDNKCLQAISVAEVVAAARESLRRAGLEGEADARATVLPVLR
jgi:ADP-heptose:LPS heptosyltransferase